ncbi:MAG: DUF4173 domain-containing protein, partial [Mycobacteriales bacterium]
SPQSALECRPDRSRLVAAAIAGLVGAIAVPDAPPGLGLAVTTLAIAAALLPAMRARATWWSRSAGAGAVLLAGLSVVRDAEWLIALDLVAAFALGSMALAGGRTFRELIKGSASVVIAGPMAPAHLAKPVLARLAVPRTRKLGPAIRAGLVSALVLIVFGALFASADAVFDDLADRLVPPLDVELAPSRVIVFLLVAGLVGAGALVATRVQPVGLSGGLSGFADLLLAPLDPERVQVRPARIEWMAPLVVLNLLFAVFVGVQFAAFFGGRDHLVRTPGLTAAEYARSGFFQLLTVCLLTLAVVALAVRWVDASERARLRLLLGPLCLLTGVVLVSAAHRLHHYQEAFGYTRLRLVVDVSLAVIGVVLALLMVAGALWRAGWMPRAVLAAAIGGLLALNVMNADAFIARRNIERARAGAQLDTDYLSGLSADAAGELVSLPDAARSCALSRLRARLDRLDDAGWRGANMSRRSAREVLDTYGLGHGPECGR